MEAINNLFGYFLKTPPTSFKYFWVILIFSGFAFIGAILSSKYLKKKIHPALKKKISPYPGRIITMAIICIILTLARSQGIFMFSSRILLFVSLFLLIYFIAYPIYFYFRKSPEIIKKVEIMGEKDKYLPKKKKGKKKKR